MKDAYAVVRKAIRKESGRKWTTNVRVAGGNAISKTFAKEKHLRRKVMIRKRRMCHKASLES